MDFETTPEQSGQSQDAGTQSSPDVSQQHGTQQANPTTPPMTDLDKLEKFRFEGREYTLKELKAERMRQQDYTRKTQEHSKSVESFKSEQKFYDNLAYDLMKVRDNPQLASEFIKIYPEKFHTHLRNVLNQNQPNQAQGAQGQQKQNPQIDVELMSRIHKLENFYQEQEVSKQTTFINTKMDEISKKYPDALPEMVLAKVYEAYNSDENTQESIWEQVAEGVDKQVKNLLKERYGSLVKKQTAANSKSRDVEGGGGTVGRAPPKFKNLADVTKFAAESLSRKG